MAEALSDAEQEAVESERAELQKFIKGLSPDDLKSGNWFTKLLAHSLSAYTKEG